MHTHAIVRTNVDIHRLELEFELAQNVGALDRVLQLAHIARPVVFAQRLQRASGEHLGGAVARIQFTEKVIGEQRDVIATIAQRRERDGEHRQSIQQILAQRAVAYRLHRRAVGRGYDAHIGLDLLGAADTKEALGLEKAQQSRLHVGAHLGDLIQKQRAARGTLDHAGVAAGRAGETAPLEAEQLGLDQRRRQGTAVDAKERSGTAPAARVDRLGDQLLARAALAGNQYGRLGRRDFLDQVTNGLNGVGAADHPI